MRAVRIRERVGGGAGPVSANGSKAPGEDLGVPLARNLGSMGYTGYAQAFVRSDVQELSRPTRHPPPGGCLQRGGLVLGLLSGLQRVVERSSEVLCFSPADQYIKATPLRGRSVWGSLCQRQYKRRGWGVHIGHVGGLALLWGVWGVGAVLKTLGAERRCGLFRRWGVGGGGGLKDIGG